MMVQAQSQEQDSVWVLVMKDGKWVPDSKYECGFVGTALKRAEELDHSPNYDGVKAVKMSPGSRVPKELWVSDRVTAQENARRANQLSQGMAKTASQFTPKRSRQN